jgi:16S rRNA (cytidine1402-2'-O)-methyltransferase
MKTTGTLYLIPTLLDDAGLSVIPEYVQSITSELSIFFVENERTARRNLRKSGYTRSFDEVQLYVLDKDTDPSTIKEYIQIIIQQGSAGILSEAGVPCVADPGSALVLAAHVHNIPVVPLVGPSSLLLALMASGLYGQRFAFQGYLPVIQKEREQALHRLEKLVMMDKQTQIFIETPYRNQSMVQDILRVCQPTTLLSIAYGLTGPLEWIKTRSIADWRKHPPKLEKVPAVFLLGM